MWFDSADIYTSRMDLIAESSILGLLLVFLVLVRTTRPRVALWVTAGIGVSFIGAFAFLPANDVSLNVISTFAFLLVLGIVVDDAIVVGESIHHYSHNEGLSGEAAAVEGTMSVARPVIFAVLTTIVAFAPWLFVFRHRGPDYPSTVDRDYPRPGDVADRGVPDFAHASATFSAA